MHDIKWLYRNVAASLALCLVLLTAGCGQKGADTAPPPSGGGMMGSTSRPMPQQQGMSTKKKVVLLAGAALLYYLYKKHQASQQASASGAQGQLYRSKNGGIYYRDAQHNPVWLTVPQQGMQVPEDQVQRYAPDYNNYRGSAPPAPPGYRTEPFSSYDSM